MKWDRIVAVSVATVGTMATHLWGGADEILILLITLMSLDYILGIICGYKRGKLSSVTGFQGLLKKMTILIIIAVGVSVDAAVGAEGAVRAMVIFFYVGMEGISILENAVIIGVPVPDKLEEALIQLRQGNRKGDK